jgi:hypothetical protein
MNRRAHCAIQYPQKSMQNKLLFRRYVDVAVSTACCCEPKSARMTVAGAVQTSKARSYLAGCSCLTVFGGDGSPAAFLSTLADAIIFAFKGAVSSASDNSSVRVCVSKK